MPNTTPVAPVEPDLTLIGQLNHPVLVLVSRDGRRWQAEVAALGTVRKARTLVALDNQIRDILGTNSVGYEFHTGEIIRQNENRIRRLTEQASLLPSGGSVRELAVLLGMSHQRIYQVMRSRGAQTSTKE